MAVAWIHLGPRDIVRYFNSKKVETDDYVIGYQDAFYFGTPESSRSNSLTAICGDTQLHRIARFTISV